MRIDRRVAAAVTALALILGVTVVGNNASAGRIQVRFVCERGHRPSEHGMLEFDPADARWVERHRDDCVQRMAECFLESYVEKRKRREVTEAAS